MNLKTTFLSFGLLTTSLLSHSQTLDYRTNIGQAMALYKQKSFLKSGQMFNANFREHPQKVTPSDKYNAACTWALANQPDSAFAHLLAISENGDYTRLSHIQIDQDLTSLHSDKRWNTVISNIKKHKAIKEANYDQKLVATLDQVYMDDQKLRHQIDGIEKKYGWESDEMSHHWKKIHVMDSINLKKVTQILDTKGWLGADKIGPNGNSTLFLVIQHADVETQKKYLPMMREAAKDNRAHPANLALLEDRVAMHEGKRQIYGSQIQRNQTTGEYFVYPLQDPDNVNKRRSSVGLGTIESYVMNWNIKWNAEKHKKMTEEMEKRKRN